MSVKNASTKSRKKVTISVDDTVLQRYGKVLSLTYSWWSGRVKKTVKGQNILGIVIKIVNKIKERRSLENV